MKQIVRLNLESRWLDVCCPRSTVIPDIGSKAQRALDKSFLGHPWRKVNYWAVTLHFRQPLLRSGDTKYWSNISSRDLKSTLDVQCLKNYGNSSPFSSLDERKFALALKSPPFSFVFNQLLCAHEFLFRPNAVMQGWQMALLHFHSEGNLSKVRLFKIKH